jgi:hypothetical protein
VGRPWQASGPGLHSSLFNIPTVVFIPNVTLLAFLGLGVGGFIPDIMRDCTNSLVHLYRFLNQPLNIRYVITPSRIYGS